MIAVAQRHARNILVTAVKRIDAGGIKVFAVVAKLGLEQFNCPYNPLRRGGILRIVFRFLNLPETLFTRPRLNTKKLRPDISHGGKTLQLGINPAIKRNKN